MKRCVRLLRRLSALPLLALAAGPAPADPVAVTSRIESVTVYADRAQVRRAGDLRLAKGEAEYVFAGLPSWIDEESLRAALEPAGAGRIADVRLKRDHLTRSTDEEVRAAEKAAQEIQDRLEDLQDEVKVQDARAKQLTDIRAFSMEKLPREAAVPQVPIEAYGKTVDYIAETLRSIGLKRREIERQVRDLQPEVNARQGRLKDVQERRQLEQSTITVVVDGNAPGPARLRLEYLLPGATWEPVHELRSVGPSPTNVSISSWAVVSQTTGEDWAGAELSFSTQSPEQVMKVPELQALRVGTQATPPADAAQSGSFGVAREKYLAGNKMWFMANNGAADMDFYNANGVRQLETEGRALTAFTQLQQKRGTTAHFAGEGRPAVRADGRQVRVKIGQAEFAAHPRIIAAPEVSLNAAHTVDLVNTGTQPLLPGRVSLFREGAFLGTTDLDFVAAGESSTVLMGVADRVKLSRVLDRRQSALVRGQRTRVQAAFDVTVENLSDAAVSVRLHDRIPVSENKDIRVSDVRIQPEGEPDSKGLVVWSLELKPREKRAFRIAYTMEYPSQLPDQATRRARAADANLAPAPAAAPQADIYQQIESLEKKF